MAKVGSAGGLPTTIAWGTDGLLVGSIVISARYRLLHEDIGIPNGTGLTATLVLLQDGTEVTLDVVDDLNVVFPDYGSNITLLNPRANNVPTSTVFLVLDNDYDAERKQEGRRSIMARKYTLGIP